MASMDTNFVESQLKCETEDRGQTASRNENDSNALLGSCAASV